MFINLEVLAPLLSGAYLPLRSDSKLTTQCRKKCRKRHFTLAERFARDTVSGKMSLTSWLHLIACRRTRSHFPQQAKFHELLQMALRGSRGDAHLLCVFGLGRTSASCEPLPTGFLPFAELLQQFFPERGSGRDFAAVNGQYQVLALHGIGRQGQSEFLRTFF